MNEWINVKDRLPAFNDLVLVYRKNCPLNDRLVLAYIPNHSPIPKEDTNFTCIKDGEILWQVSHWMPLPEPPNE